VATATCPAGHTSTTDDYCDTCGAPIGAAEESSAAPVAEAAEAESGSATAEAAAEPAAATCPSCGETVDSRFCESCGYDLEENRPAPPPPEPEPTAPDPPPAPPPSASEATATPAPPAPEGPVTATLVIGADQAHWDRMVGSGEPAFPSTPPALTFELRGDRMTLGRVRGAGPADVDLALAGPAADPAVSHHQSEFTHNGEHWSVRDSGSSNGTWINDSADPLPDGVSHQLAEGDRILIGAWTSLTIHYSESTP
jgi:hypothetical protein